MLPPLENFYDARLLQPSIFSHFYKTSTAPKEYWHSLPLCLQAITANPSRTPSTSNFYTYLACILLLSKFVLAPKENVHSSQRRLTFDPRAFTLDRPLLAFSHFCTPPHLYAKSRIVAAPKAGTRFSHSIFRDVVPTVILLRHVPFKKLKLFLT